MLKPGPLPEEYSTPVTSSEWTKRESSFTVGRKDDIIKMRRKSAARARWKRCPPRNAGWRRSYRRSRRYAERHQSCVRPQKVDLTAEVIRRCSLKLGGWFKFVDFQGELPKTSTGKISKRSWRSPLPPLEGGPQ
jgi:hypothetical protein